MRNFLKFVGESTNSIANTKIDRTIKSIQFNIDKTTKDIQTRFRPETIENGIIKVKTRAEKYQFDMTKLVKESRAMKSHLANELLNGNFSKEWAIKKRGINRANYIILNKKDPFTCTEKALREYLTSVIKDGTKIMRYWILLDYLIKKHDKLKLNIQENKIVIGKQTFKASKLLRNIAKKYGYNLAIVDELLQDITTKATKGTDLEGIFSLKVEDFIYQSHGNSWSSCHQEQVDSNGWLGRGSNSQLPWLSQGLDFVTGMLYIKYDGKITTLLSRKTVYINSKEKTFALGRSYPASNSTGGVWNTAEGKYLIDKFANHMISLGYTRASMGQARLTDEVEEYPRLNFKWGSNNRIFGYHDFSASSSSTQNLITAGATSKTLTEVMDKIGAKWIK